MIRVMIVCGDALGGPSAVSELDLDREVESLTDEEIEGWTGALRKLFVAGHGREPESVIVTVN